MKPSIEAVGIVIPAHDEQDRIGASMSSVSTAARAVHVDVEVVIVLDACTDRTEAIVRGLMATDDSVGWHCLSTSFRRASSSRDAGLGVTVETFSARSSSRVAVLSTDADTEVPSDWITHHVRRLDSGDDAIAGIVDLEPSADGGLCHDSWRAEYRSGFRADGTHPHVHCANLAVRLDVLLEAGGFGDLARAEDIDLWRRLGATSARLRSDQESIVRTSSRSDGRVDGGFATALRQFRKPGRAVVAGRPGDDATTGAEPVQ